MWGFWVLLILLVLIVASLPVYPYSRRWGFGPAGLLVAITAVWAILIWTRTIGFWWPWAVPPELT